MPLSGATEVGFFCTTVFPRHVLIVPVPYITSWHELLCLLSNLADLATKMCVHLVSPFVLPCFFLELPLPSMVAAG